MKRVPRIFPIFFFSLILVFVGCSWPHSKSKKWGEMNVSPLTGRALGKIWRLDQGGTSGFREPILKVLDEREILKGKTEEEIKRYLGNPDMKGGVGLEYYLSPKKSCLISLESEQRKISIQELADSSLVTASVKFLEFGPIIGELFSAPDLSGQEKQRVAKPFNGIAQNEVGLSPEQVRQMFGEPSKLYEARGSYSMMYLVGKEQAHNTEHYLVFRFSETLEFLSFYPISYSEGKDSSH